MTMQAERFCFVNGAVGADRKRKQPRWEFESVSRRAKGELTANQKGKVACVGGFRRWLARHARFVRALMLIVIYAAIVPFVIALLLVRGFPLPTEILGLMLLTALAVFFASYGFHKLG